MEIENLEMIYNPDKILLKNLLFLMVELSSIIFQKMSFIKSRICACISLNDLDACKRSTIVAILFGFSCSIKVKFLNFLRSPIRFSTLNGLFCVFFQKEYGS